ncbi:hypothetical protein ACXR2T_10715 [Leucobacter sp. HY1910]
MSSQAFSVSECARGCTIAAVEGGPRTPAPAVAGAVLCARCLARLAWLLGDIDDVAARARAAVVPSIGGAQNERVSGSTDPGLPLNAGAMDACDLLVAMLGNWVTYWARACQIAPPRALAGALAADRDVSGVTVAATPESVAAGISEWAIWLRRNLDHYQANSALADFLDDLATTTRKVDRAFPRDDARKVGQEYPRFCPICELQRVWLSWPRGSDPIVACGSCGWAFDTDWEELLNATGISSRST